MPKKWIIPDIHGCAKTLQALFHDYIKPSKGDELYFLGDYIDRGPDAKGVIDFIMKLQKDDHTIHLLKGNHEEICVNAYREEERLKSFIGIKGKNVSKVAWLQYGGKETMRSFGIKNLRDMPAEYVEWMDGLKTHIILDDFVLVHAGLNFSNTDPYEDENAMLWSRDFGPQSEKIGGRTLIHGHMPINLETIFMLKENPEKYKYIDLDNGAFMAGREGFGNLVVLELNSMELYSQYNLDM